MLRKPDNCKSYRQWMANKGVRMQRIIAAGHRGERAAAGTVPIGHHSIRNAACYSTLPETAFSICRLGSVADETLGPFADEFAVSVSPVRLPLGNKRDNERLVAAWWL